MYKHNKKYGWVPDLPDIRDFKYAAPRRNLFTPRLPKKVDLSGLCPAVYDQGVLGSCTANAIAAAIQFDLMKQKAEIFMPSRLFIYYNERVLEGTASYDSGATLRSGLKTVVKEGTCPEPEWEYVIHKFSVKPPKPCYASAQKHQVLEYRRVAQKLSEIKGCLAEGYPFVFGFMCYDSFESPEVSRSGDLSLPQAGETPRGGHAVMCVGYDDDLGVVKILNSWGASWGAEGYFTMPYSYIENTDLARDFWTIRLVEQ